MIVSELERCNEWYTVIPPLPEVGGVAQNYGPKSMMKWIFSQDEICRKILRSLNFELQLSTSTCAPHVFALWRNGLWKWHPILWPCFFCTRATGIHEKSHHYIIASTAGHVKRGSLTTMHLEKMCFGIFYFCLKGTSSSGVFRCHGTNARCPGAALERLRHQFSFIFVFAVSHRSIDHLICYFQKL